MAAVLMGFCHNIQASSVIPRPLTETAVPSGDFVLSPRTVISYDRSLLPQAEYLCGVFAGSTGWDLSLREGHKGHIRLVVDSAAVPSPEGYTLQVTPKAVTITGHDAAGVFTAYRHFCNIFLQKSMVTYAGPACGGPYRLLLSPMLRPTRGAA